MREHCFLTISIRRDRREPLYLKGEGFGQELDCDQGALSERDRASPLLAGYPFRPSRSADHSLNPQAPSSWVVGDVEEVAGVHNNGTVVL